VRVVGRMQELSEVGLRRYASKGRERATLMGNVDGCGSDVRGGYPTHCRASRETTPRVWRSESGVNAPWADVWLRCADQGLSVRGGFSAWLLTGVDSKERVVVGLRECMPWNGFKSLLTKYLHKFYTFTLYDIHCIVLLICV
jgi:hypothetical protein